MNLGETLSKIISDTACALIKNKRKETTGFLQNHGIDWVLSLDDNLFTLHLYSYQRMKGVVYLKQDRNHTITFRWKNSDIYAGIKSSLKIVYEGCEFKFDFGDTQIVDDKTEEAIEVFVAHIKFFIEYLDIDKEEIIRRL